jgi:hypothetical protein
MNFKGHNIDCRFFFANVLVELLLHECSSIGGSCLVRVLPLMFEIGGVILRGLMPWRPGTWRW